VLALMDHPNIAKVLDAGATDSGQPYFVMELVAGSSIIDYCDSRQLGTRDRLGLFESVCQAVQHAHQKGVIHRDLKPGNVLVTEIDGRPVAKVIDFGVAKALDPDLTQRSIDTEPGLLVGTREYMSPEMASLGGIDIDTRSDIYSLGVLLYELLTGATPFAEAKPTSLPFLETMRIIREKEPPPLSWRLRDHETHGRAASQRGTGPAQLLRQVRGELEWIAAKTLEKDRDRRYESAAALAADLRRFQRNEPVLAGPPSRAYQLAKFVRRNRGADAAAGLLFAALLAGTVGTSIGLIQARRAGGVIDLIEHIGRHGNSTADKRQAESLR
jgi:eukaryotic-like serine/threonine-protein kinase